MSLCKRECTKCNMYMHCKGCSFCEIEYCKEDCYQCFSLCPNRGSSFNYLKNLGGGEISLLPNKKYNLPVFIPVLPDKLTEPLSIGNVVGINGANFFSKNGEKITLRYQKNSIKETLNLKDDNVCGVLEFYVKDRPLEGFWDNRKQLYQELKKIDFRAIISPNFSVYEDAPRIDHLYNMKRSSIVYNEMIKEGLPAIPDLSWYNKIDLDQWIREINIKGLKTIGFSFQVVNVTLKASHIWKHYLLGFKYLCDNIPGDVQIVIAGAVSPARVRVIKDAAPNNKLIILNQSAFVHSRKGMLSEGRIREIEIPKNEVFLKNIEYFKREYEKINNLKGEK